MDKVRRGVLILMDVHIVCVCVCVLHVRNHQIKDNKYFLCMEERSSFHKDIKISVVIFGLYDSKQRKEAEKTKMEWCAKISHVRNGPSTSSDLLHLFRRYSYFCHCYIILWVSVVFQDSNRYTYHSSYYWNNKNYIYVTIRHSLQVTLSVLKGMCVVQRLDCRLPSAYISPWLGQRGQKKSPGEPSRLRKALHNCPVSETQHLSRDCSLALISSITITSSSSSSSQPTHTLISTVRHCTGGALLAKRNRRLKPMNLK